MNHEPERAPAAAARDDVRPGRILERALTVRTGRRWVDLAAAWSAFAVMTLGSLAAIGGTVFLVGAGASWLHEHVEFFESHPRLAVAVTAGFASAMGAAAFVAGRSTGGNRRGTR